MNENPYDVVRDSVMSIGLFSINDVVNNVVIWKRVLKSLNDRIKHRIEDIRVNKPSNKEIDIACLSDEFKFVLQEENENLVPDLKYKCRQTKTDFIIKLFKPYESWAQDVNPKTKDFLAVISEYNGWNDLVDDFKSSFKEKKELDTNNLVAKAEIKSDLFQRLMEGSKEYFEELFGQLNISEILIPKWKQESMETGVKIDGKSNEVGLIKGVESLWSKMNWNCIIIGEGGMGKTYSFIRLWKYYLAEQQQLQIIPIYIPLNRYNDANETEKKSFIAYYILKNYLNERVISESLEKTFWDSLMNEVGGSSQKKPKIVLLLDGLNEVTENDVHIRKDLDDWWFSKTKGVQTIISSRYDIRDSNRWQTLRKITLQPLTKRAIKEYLNGLDVEFPKDEELLSIISNPLMLTLYATSNDNIEKYKDSPEFEFKSIFTSQGELMWNFYESQLAKQFETNRYDDKTYKYYSFLLKHLTSYIGFKMEEKGQYNISETELVKIVDIASIAFYNEDFVNTFPIYRGYLSQFNLEKKPFPENDKKFKTVSDILCEKLQILIKEGYSYRFIHQNFRDFSASIYVINDLLISNQSESISKAIHNRVLPLYIRKYVGEIEGEHKKKVVLSKKKVWEVNNNSENSISVQLELLRGNFKKEIVGYSVWNIVEIFKDLRKELTGIDLRKLNLQETDLNGIRCFKKHHNNYLSVNFDHALISENNLFPNGHIGNILSIIYSPDGEKFASVATDNKIKEWRVTTGKHIKTYASHTDIVTSIAYRFDGKTLLSASWDKTLKEWSTENGDCIRTIEETAGIDIATYTPRGKGILYGLSNGVIKKLSIENNEIVSCGKEGWFNNIESLCFNNIGDKFLSSSGKFIQEWDTSSLKCINTYDFARANINKVLYLPNDEDNILCTSSLHGSLVIFSLSQKKELRHLKIGFFSEERIMDIDIHSDGENIIAGTNKGNVYWWDIKSKDEEPKQKFAIANGRINSVSFGLDGQNFVCSPEFRNAEEWSLVTKQSLKNFGSNLKGINTISYSPCGTKFILGTKAGDIQEWSAENKKCINVYTGHYEGINDVEYSPNGKTIISCSNDKTVKLWSTETSICIHTFKEHEDIVNTVAYSKNGTMIASGSRDRSIRVWSTEERINIQTIKDTGFRIFDIRFSPNEKTILSASLSNELNEWSIETGDCSKTYSAHKTSIYSCDYSPDGSRVISGSRDFNLKLWNTKNEDCLNTVHAQNNGVHYARFSPDGKKVLSCGNNHYLYEWVIGEEQRDEDKIKAHKENIEQVEYSPDGKRALSCSDDGTVKEWLVANWSCLETYKIIHGLFINGCVFNDLHKASEISTENKEMLKKYGAIFCDN